MTKGTPESINFVFEKETPGAVRFQEVDATGNKVKVEGGAKIGTLYVRKTALNGEVPQKLLVTVTPQ